LSGEFHVQRSLPSYSLVYLSVDWLIQWDLEVMSKAELCGL
jgi:hypothetical protein